MPQIWDLLTGLRLVFAAAGVAAWLAVGWLLAPWLWGRFEAGTSGYVRWMQQMFDRMFLTIPASWCVGGIIASMSLSIAAGWFLTSGIPFDPWAYNLIRV